MINSRSCYRTDLSLGKQRAGPSFRSMELLHVAAEGTEKIAARPPEILALLHTPRAMAESRHRLVVEYLLPGRHP